MLEHLLGQEGYAVTTAANGEEALKLAHEESFHLYIIDTWLVKEDGNSLCRKIREFDARTPIIIYSGAAYQTDQRAAIDAGADAFIAKPHITELIQTTRRLLKF
jgi:DNA-binding response OmpR family regulator